MKCVFLFSKYCFVPILYTSGSLLTVDCKFLNEEESQLFLLKKEIFFSLNEQMAENALSYRSVEVQISP